MPNLAGNPARILKRKAQMLARRDGIADQEAFQLLKEWEQDSSSGSGKSTLDPLRDRGPVWGMSARRPSLDEYDR